MANHYEEIEMPKYEITRKRRKGFPSETRVKRGEQIVHGDKELSEKLGRNDLCPCGSARRFKELLHAFRKLRWPEEKSLFSASEKATRVNATPAEIIQSALLNNLNF